MKFFPWVLVAGLGFVAFAAISKYGKSLQNSAPSNVPVVNPNSSKTSEHVSVEEIVASLKDLAGGIDALKNSTETIN